MNETTNYIIRQKNKSSEKNNLSFCQKNESGMIYDYIVEN